MSHQATQWALHDAPMLLTDKGKPDSTARLVLLELAEHAHDDGTGTYPSVLHIRWATGLDGRTIQRALRRLEQADLIRRDGTSRTGTARWKLALSLKRPPSDWDRLEAEADGSRQAETDRRRARRHRAGEATSGTQSPGQAMSGTESTGQDHNQGVSTGQPSVRDADSRTCPGRKVPASGTENPGVRDAAPPEPSVNHQEPSSLRARDLAQLAEAVGATEGEIDQLARKIRSERPDVREPIRYLAACHGKGDLAPMLAELRQRQADQAAAQARSAEARQRAADRNLAIANCALCDDAGYIGRQLCDHNPHSVDVAARGMARVRAALRQRTTQEVTTDAT